MFELQYVWNDYTKMFSISYKKARFTYATISLDLELATERINHE